MSEGIPEGWEIATIAKVGKVVTGSTPSTKNPTYWNGSVPFISPADFRSSVYVKNTERTLSEEGAKQGRLLPRDSILVTCIGSLGGIAMNPKEATTNQQINAVVPYKNNNPHYCYYAILHNIDELKKNAGTTTLPIINKSTFETIKILRATQPEQQKIASILTSVDEVIEKTEAQISKLQDLKKGMMQELLTKGIGHTEFKDSLVGRIPKEWDISTINKIEVSVIDGDRGKEYPRENDFFSWESCLFLSAKNVTKDGFKFEECAFITKEKDRKLRKGKLEKDDIVITTRGTVGNIAYFDNAVPFESVRINSGMAILRNKSKSLTTKFLYDMLQSPIIRKQIETLTFGSAQPQLTIGLINDFLIPVPSKDEQSRISTVLSGVTELLKLQQRKLAGTVHLKKSLMQDLLTGKVRVKVN